MKLDAQYSNFSSARQSLLSKESKDPIQPFEKYSTKAFKEKDSQSIMYQMIADPSHTLDSKINIENEILDRYRFFEVIIPENIFLIIWHCILVSIIIYYQIETGLLLMFGQVVWEEQLDYLLWLNIIFILILAIDIALCPLKTYYEFGFLITKKQQILSNYLKWRFWCDFICLLSIMIPYITKSFIINWIKTIFVVYKLYDLNFMDLQLQRIVQNKLRQHTFYMLSRLIYLLFIGSHYIGLGFYLVDWYVYTYNYYGPNTPNYCWIYSAQSYTQIILELSWANQYLYTLYFSIGTMTTIAYGDITPLSPISALYIIFAFIPYTLGFGYIVSEVLRIVIEAQAYRFQYSNNLIIISNLIKNRKISSGTQTRILSYFEESWLQEKFRNRTIQKALVNSLPNKLKNKLLITVYKTFLKQVGFIRPQDDIQRILNNQKSSFLLAFTSQISQERLAEGVVIYDQGKQYNQNQFNSHCMYFFQQKNHWNSIALGIGKKPIIDKYLLDHSPKSIEHIYKGLMKLSYANRIFGEIEFFTGNKRKHWAVTNRSCLVYEISRKTYLQLKSKQWIVSQRELIMLVQEGIDSSRCYLCHNMGHQFARCPLGTYNPKILDCLGQKDLRVRKMMRINKKLIETIRKERQIRSNKINSLRNHKQLTHIFNNKLTQSKLKKTLLSSKYYELQQSSSSQSSQSDGEGSSEDLDNYISQTKFLVDKLVHNDLIHQEKDCYDVLDMDVRKDFEIYKTEDNFHSVVSKYHSTILGDGRRKMEISNIQKISESLEKRGLYVGNQKKKIK